MWFSFYCRVSLIAHSMVLININYYQNKINKIREAKKTQKIV